MPRRSRSTSRKRRRRSGRKGSIPAALRPWMAVLNKVRREHPSWKLGQCMKKAKTLYHKRS